MSADTIVNVAKAAWDVFKDDAPSADISGSTANAVPKVDDWQDLQGTRGPMWVRESWQRMCAWPMDDYIVAEFSFYLKWDYGATYHGGGAFIPNIWIEVPSYDIFWGQHIFLSATVHNPTNASTIPNAPLARVPVTISGTARNSLRDLHIEWSYNLYGDGRFERGVST
jgi:hypothetical protein